MQFTAACIQTNCQDDLAANVAAVLPWVEKAAQGGAKLICLPENAFLMEKQADFAVKPGDFIEKKSRKLLPAHVPVAEHPGVLGCQELAKRYGVWVLVGSVPVTDISPPLPTSPPSGGGGERKIHNTSILINDKGEIASQYQKIHLFDVDLGNGESYCESRRVHGGCEARLVQLPWAKLGMSICYDLRFPHLYRQLAQAGAEILAIPAAFTKVTGEAHWHVLQRARAIENGCFVLAPAQTGEHPGKRFTYGHSLIIDPWGKVLADAGENVGIISATIDMDLVASARLRMPSLQHDREFTICG